MATGTPTYLVELELKYFTFNAIALVTGSTYRFTTDLNHTFIVGDSVYINAGGGGDTGTFTITNIATPNTFDVVNASGVAGTWPLSLSESPTVSQWVDVTSYVDGGSVTINQGTAGASTDVQPGTLAFSLYNVDGRFIPDNPASPYFPNFTDGKRVRVTVTKGTNSSVRFFGRITDLAPNMTTDAQQSTTDVIASDALGSMQRRQFICGYQSEIARMVMGTFSQRRYLPLNGLTNTVLPLVFWPLTEAQGSTTFYDMENAQALNSVTVPPFVSTAYKTSAGYVDAAADTSFYDGLPCVTTKPYAGLRMGPFAFSSMYGDQTQAGLSFWLKLPDSTKGSAGEVFSISPGKHSPGVNDDVNASVSAFYDPTTYILTMYDGQGLVAGTTGSGGGAGSASFTVASATGIRPGQYAYGTGIATGSQVTSVSGTTITVTPLLTGTVSGTVGFNDFVQVPNIRPGWHHFQFTRNTQGATLADYWSIDGGATTYPTGGYINNGRGNSWYTPNGSKNCYITFGGQNAVVSVRNVGVYQASSYKYQEPRIGQPLQVPISSIAQCVLDLRALVPDASPSYYYGVNPLPNWSLNPWGTSAATGIETAAPVNIAGSNALEVFLQLARADGGYVAAQYGATYGYPMIVGRNYVRRNDSPVTSTASAFAVSGSQVTVTTSTQHGLLTGMWVRVTGCSVAANNGWYQITVTSLTSFWYLKSGAATATTATIQGYVYPSLTLDSEADLSDAPSLVRENVNKFATATATSTLGQVSAGDFSYNNAAALFSGTTTNVSAALANYADLYSVASQLVAQSNQGGVRIASLTFDLATSSNDRFADFFAITPGSTVTITGLPATHFGQTSVTGCIEGWTETLSLEGYEVTLNLSSIQVRETSFDSDVLGWGDGNAYLVAGITSSATTAQIAWSSGALANTAATTVNTTGTGVGNTNPVTVASATGIVAGMNVTGTGVRAGCQVQQITGTAVTLDPPLATGISGGALSFTAGFEYPLDLSIGGERVTISIPAGSASPQTVTITARGVGGTVARAHNANEPIEVWTPATFAL